MQIRLTQSTDDLIGIKSLQSQNLKANLSEAEKISEGFVTASYTMEALDQMHHLLPSVIAVDHDKIVGYALVLDKRFKGTHHLIDDLIENIDKHYYLDEKLAFVNYAVVGQLCVDKQYRGQGLASKLYLSFKDHYSKFFPYCITDVDQSNKRSLQAHYKTGFQTLGQLQFENADFEIVLWNWNQ
jgi:GNAT superfamily N-acetyltransferase